MRFLTEFDYRAEAEHALRKIFLTDSLCYQEFGVNAQSRKFLCDYCPPDRQIIEAIAQAASTLGDDGFYLAEWGEHISIIDSLGWITDLFDRIYGRETTKEMLKEVGLYDPKLFEPRPPLFRPSLEMRGTTKLPLGTKKGLEELKAILAASEPTNDRSTRRVVISRHQELPEPFASMEPGSTAIRVFFMMAAPDSHSALTLDSSEGQQAKLSNGGTIRLKRTQIEENNNSYHICEIHLQDHGILGYERVNRIEFVAH